MLGLHSIIYPHSYEIQKRRYSITEGSKVPGLPKGLAQSNVHDWIHVLGKEESYDSDARTYFFLMELILVVQGLIVSTAMVTFFTAGITFLLVWPTTRPFVVNIAAQVLGIVITILVKIILCFLAMRTAYAGFYRTKPMFANIFCFALECWNLALTLALVAGRLGKFIVLTSFYIGRIDRPVLADGLFLKVDNLPVIFYQNLISTDSHRHPYVEQLSVMYLMKLRHRENFGSRAGSIWRLLFVSALMPWLKKKRIQDDDVDIGKLRSFISNGNQGSSKQIEVEQDQVKESSLEKVEETKLEDL